MLLLLIWIVSLSLLWWYQSSSKSSAARRFISDYGAQQCQRWQQCRSSRLIDCESNLRVAGKSILHSSKWKSYIDNNYTSSHWFKLSCLGSIDETSFDSQNKFRFVNGTIGIFPPQDLNYDAWEWCNNLVQSWLVSLISPPIAQTVVFLENAVDVWNELRERFSKADRIRIADLQNSISTLLQGNSSVIEYYTALKSFWEELEHYRPLCHCECHNCKAKEFRL